MTVFPPRLALFFYFSILFSQQPHKNNRADSSSPTATHAQTLRATHAEYIISLCARLPIALMESTPDPGDRPSSCYSTEIMKLDIALGNKLLLQRSLLTRLTLHLSIQAALATEQLVVEVESD